MPSRVISGIFRFGHNALTQQITLDIVSGSKEMKKNNENVMEMIPVGDIPRRAVQIVGYGNKI